LRSLVISDLHFGTLSRADLLRGADARAPLLREVAQCDRLVLLGDLLELRHGPVREALRAARGPLGEIGSALGAGGEVVIVAGNHDHYLVHGWTQRRAADGPAPALGLETEVDWRSGEPLHALAGMLAPARVRAAYPGVWLRDDVYATHGHYLDLHLTVPTLERLGAGVMRRIVALDPEGPRTAEDYESVLVPIYAWVHVLAQLADPERSRVLHGGSVRGWRALTGPRRRLGVRGTAVAAAWPVAIAACNRAGLGPLRAELSGPELRRAGLRALGEVVWRLGVDAAYVLFGHTHRAGPLPADDPADWRTVAGARLINAGCWVHEPAFIGTDPSRSPYRAGFGVVVGDDGPPLLRNLLDR
jgi:Calcineurin-like phosphoesterase superfamily domain